MDDEAIIRLLCGKAFVRVGLEVTTTANGSEAVREFSQAWERGRPYQLVIFDLTVPGGMGGKDALTEVRKIDPSIRAIASSGYSNDPVMADYRRFGFDAIVPKPYEIDQMIDTVRHVLAQKG
jgi:DNA-binding NtrC family response regulator